MRPRRCRFCRQAIAAGTGHRPLRALIPTPAREWESCDITGVALERANQRCPRCGGSLITLADATQLSLLRHGGYGGDERTVRVGCISCAYSSGSRIETTNPRHRGTP